MPSLSEIIYTCAIIACVSEDEPPPALMTISDIYETFDLIAAEQAPYLSDKQAIIANNERKIDELQAEVKDLEKRLLSALHTLSDMESRQASEKVKTEKQAAASQTINAEATFYTAFCPTGCTGVTATGINVSNSIYHDGKRVIAVDPSVIPLRSIVRVTLENGDEFEAIAGDTGGDIKGNRIDVLVADRAEAYRLGRQKAMVEILRKEE